MSEQEVLELVDMYVSVLSWEWISGIFLVVAVPFLLGFAQGTGWFAVFLLSLVWPVLQFKAWFSTLEGVADGDPEDKVDENELYYESCRWTGFLIVAIVLISSGIRSANANLEKPLSELSPYDRLFGVVASEWNFVRGLRYAVFGYTEEASSSVGYRVRNAALFWQAFAARTWSDLLFIPLHIFWMRIVSLLGGRIFAKICWLFTPRLHGRTDGWGYKGEKTGGSSRMFDDEVAR